MIDLREISGALRSANESLDHEFESAVAIENVGFSLEVLRIEETKFKRSQGNDQEIPIHFVVVHPNVECREGKFLGRGRAIPGDDVTHIVTNKERRGSVPFAW